MRKPDFSLLTMSLLSCNLFAAMVPRKFVGVVLSVIGANHKLGSLTATGGSANS